MRPANMITSVSDVLAGIAISGFFSAWVFDAAHFLPVLLLSICTAALYGGGVVFNDVFDADLDRTERPERAIPSGMISLGEAVLSGGLLLLSGIVLAFLVSNTAGLLAVAIAIAALVYNKWGKHQFFLGPLNMGLCRGLNLLLGICILPDVMWDTWYIAIVPIIYIASITMISRGEVHGSNRTPLYTAAVYYAVVIGCIIFFSLSKGNFYLVLAFLALFAWMIYKPLLKAIQEPAGKNIGKAVKAGVIALIVMNAAWAAAAGAIFAALIIILLLPVSLYLSRLFAVT
ncbi:MAG: UbiA-like protein EboC [Sphingobacteriaceae bacterium]